MKFFWKVGYNLETEVMSLSVFENNFRDQNHKGEIKKLKKLLTCNFVEFIHFVNFISKQTLSVEVLWVKPKKYILSMKYEKCFERTTQWNCVINIRVCIRSHSLPKNIQPTNLNIYCSSDFVCSAMNIYCTNCNSPIGMDPTSHFSCLFHTLS